MISVSDASVSNPPVADPASPDQDVPARRTGISRLGAPLIVLTAAVLLVIGIANVQVARARDSVEGRLDSASAAAARVPLDLAVTDVDAVRADLNLLRRLSVAAESGSAGFGWSLAGRANLNGGSLRAVRRAALDHAALGATAVPLQDSIAVLNPIEDDATAPVPETGTNGPTQANDSAHPGTAGPDELDQLDELARDLSRYTTAAVRTGDPSAPALQRAALAAGLLPALAGAEQPRTWTVCRAATGPCARGTVSAGRLGPVTPVPTSPIPPGTTLRTATGPWDLLVVGADPDDIFGPASGWARARWNPATIFRLLCDLNSAPVTVHSVVRIEQHAIEQLVQRPR